MVSLVAQAVVLVVTKLLEMPFRLKDLEAGLEQTLTPVLAVVVLAQLVKTQMVTKVVLAVTEYQAQ
jgi:hypothetical protein